MKLRKIILTVFLEKTQKQVSPSEINIFEFLHSLCLTKIGAEYLNESIIMKDIEQKI